VQTRFFPFLFSSFGSITESFFFFPLFVKHPPPCLQERHSSFPSRTYVGDLRVFPSFCPLQLHPLPPTVLWPPCTSAFFHYRPHPFSFRLIPFCTVPPHYRCFFPSCSRTLFCTPSHKIIPDFLCPFSFLSVLVWRLLLGLFSSSPPTDFDSLSPLSRSIFAYLCRLRCVSLSVFFFTSCVFFSPPPFFLPTIRYYSPSSHSFCIAI